MIVQRFYIERYDWRVTAYYAVSRYYVDQIMDNLRSLCTECSFLRKAERNLRRNKLNSGLTYSDYRKRESVVVVALSSSAKDFHKALIHELRHVQSHIATVYGIDEKSEQVCYLLDDMVGLTHDIIAPLLCNCCRDKHYGQTYTK